ncbi:RNA polymerase sigma-70 factor, ECF subfamily [Catalinimonas alkaloidigena]|uniref:RNA polymerase sigma-70 factor, ECF subfamily n=1 Tax=Catalinimonas alkaloidigena TaxID=1075417 RepID=A0A1G8WMF0_9BACT|nr:sigma-70 family RNA polymerase sigma factor [Catalinimonas alkaloidigena]SDJ79542.1 RNA polymerase sigma-70 factor, ECF subfamily [Catalinimonas alkaloidigena]
MTAEEYSIWERQLVEDCLLGKREAQKSLYERFYGEMMGACLRYSQNREEAAEIMNDGFLKVFTRLDQYNHKNSLKGWIYRIMVNTAIDHYRRNRKHYHTLDIQYADERPFDENVVDQLSKEDLLRLVQLLPDSYRMVFNLYVLEGFAHHEIAEKLNITEGTSRSHLAKARGKLQAMVKKHQLSDYERYAG